MAEELVTADVKEKCPTCGTELIEGVCPKDGCGYKKKKIDASEIRVNRSDVYEDDWNFTFKETPEGYLMGKAVVTNIGVFTYLNADGTYRRELRLPEEVFSFESMWSLRGKPITDDHPAERVTVENVHDYAVGKTEGDPMWDQYHLAIGLVFDVKEAIEKIKGGKRALSCGYDCALEMKAGNWMGVEYDAIQHNIRYNHLSLVDKGRAGDAARLRIDSADAILIHAKDEEAPMENKALRTITIDNADYQAEDKVVEAYNAALARSDELQKTLDVSIAEKSAVVAEKDALEEKVTALQKQIDEKKDTIDKSEVDKLVKARIALLDVARNAKVEVKDSASDRDIMVAVITAKAPTAKLDGADDMYIQTRFKIVVEDMAITDKTASDEAVRAVNSPEAPAAKVDAEASRQAYKNRLMGIKSAKDGGK
jgi:hypothetical protein